VSGIFRTSERNGWQRSCRLCRSKMKGGGWRLEDDRWQIYRQGDVRWQTPGRGGQFHTRLSCRTILCLSCAPSESGMLACPNSRMRARVRAGWILLQVFVAVTPRTRNPAKHCIDALFFHPHTTVPHTLIRNVPIPSNPYLLQQLKWYRGCW
jgi:hypothetical protein